MDHLFRTCNITKSTWFQIDPKCTTPMYSNFSFVDYSHHIWNNRKWYNKMFYNTLEKNSNLIWAIWIHYNKIIFRSNKFNPVYILKQAKNTYQLTMLYNKNTNNFYQVSDTAIYMPYSNTYNNKIWCPSPASWYKWNTDASRKEAKNSSTACRTRKAKISNQFRILLRNVIFLCQKCWLFGLAE